MKRTVISFSLQLDSWWFWCGPLLFRTLERGSWKAVQLWGPGSVDPCGPHSYYHWICWTRGWLPLHILGSATLQNGSWKFPLLGVSFDQAVKRSDHAISGPVGPELTWNIQDYYHWMPEELGLWQLSFLGPGPYLHYYMLQILKMTFSPVRLPLCTAGVEETIFPNNVEKTQ